VRYKQKASVIAYVYRGMTTEGKCNYICV